MKQKTAKSIAQIAVANRQLKEARAARLANKPKYKEQLEEKSAHIRRLVEDSGKIVKDRYLKLYDDTREGGLLFSMARLVYNPGGLDNGAAHLHPWFRGSSLTVSKMRDITRRLHCTTAYIEAFRDKIAASISVPCTQGMIKADGSYNKDLEQLLTQSPEQDASDYRMAYIQKAKRELISSILSFHLENGDVDGRYIVSEDGRVRIIPWSLEVFSEEMQDAINSSTPGYPYNGYQWYSSIDGKTLVEIVHESDLSYRDGFMFMQGARYTGDAGDDREGKQRLVMGAPAIEKRPGHELAYVLKKYIRKQGSGQLGIQEAAVDIRKMAKGDISSFGKGLQTKPQVVTDLDVSRWDAHVNDFVNSLFWEVMLEILDLSDQYTADLFDWYKENYDKRELVTYFGNVITAMLPSGSSITTVFAFIVHEIYVRAANMLHYDTYKTVGWTAFCLQGDDFLGFAYDRKIAQSAQLIYEYMNCVIKGDQNWMNLDTPEAGAVFLNTFIEVNRDTPLYTFPRWNHWMGEQPTVKQRSHVDRKLLSEILQNVANPSVVELQMASFLGKLDRLCDQPYYTYLFKVEMRLNKGLKLRSWLADRCNPNSPTVTAIKQWEEIHGIERPSEEQCIADRQEARILSASEVGKLIQLIVICTQVSGDAETANKINRYYSVSRNRSAATRAINSVASKYDWEKDLRIGSVNGERLSMLQHEIAEAFEIAFYTQVKAIEAARAQEAEHLATQTEEPIVDPVDIDGDQLVVEQDTQDLQTPTLAKTAASAMTAVVDNPFEVSAMVAELAITTAAKGTLNSAQYKFVSEFYSEITGGLYLEDAVREYTSALLEEATKYDYDQLDISFYV